MFFRNEEVHNRITHREVHNKRCKNTKEILCSCRSGFLSKELHCFSELFGALFLQAEQIIQFPFCFVYNVLKVQIKDNNLDLAKTI